MTQRQRLGWALLVVIGAQMFGTVGYLVIENLSLLDAFYESIITISTVGFSEPRGGFSTAGRLFTVVLIIVGVGAAFYTAVTALELLIEEMVGGRRQERREGKIIARLDGHTIVCGYGRVGKSVANRLSEHKEELVVIDLKEDRIETARTNGLPTVRGDATYEEVLVAAGIDDARTLVACVEGDSDNLSITLSARVRKPDLYILARASNRDAERRIKMAGADRIVTPPEVGAERLAALVMHPGLTEFVDIAAGGALFEFRVEELAVGPDSELAGRSLAESQVRSRSGASVLAIRRGDGEVSTNPPASMIIEPGDTLVVMGTSDQLAMLEKLV
jgi:voltage-gated potassium channel